MHTRAAFVAVVFVALILAACGGSRSKSTPTATTATTTVTNTGTLPPANGYVAADALPRLKFDEMLGLQVIPGDEDHALLLTKEGRIRRVSMTDDGEAPAEFLDIRERIIKNPGQEEGLLGIAFAPDYASSGKFYLYFSAGDPRRQVISRFVAHGVTADAASEQVLLEIADPFSNHNGGAMTFGGDGFLYMGEGDGGSGGDPNGNGQNTNALLGKILRLDVSGDAYTSPPDNPFASGGGRAEIYAYGMRNPWRINFDRTTGKLWVADVGQGDWEEIDVVTKGGDYGWNTMEGSHCYKPNSGCNMDGLILPRTEYDHSGGNCSVTGGYVYRGAAMPELAGYYVYGDFCSGKIWAIDTTSDSSAPIMLTDTDLAISSFAEDKNHELYVISFGGKMAKLDRK